MNGSEYAESIRMDLPKELDIRERRARLLAEYKSVPITAIMILFNFMLITQWLAAMRVTPHRIITDIIAMAFLIVVAGWTNRLLYRYIFLEVKYTQAEIKKLEDDKNVKR